jgi:lipopolysaccharide biosynthesis glycosyltransferase
MTASATPIHVLFCADGRYFCHLAVAAVSLATASSSRALCIHVLTTTSDDAAARRLMVSLAPFDHVALQIHRMTPDRLAGIHGDGRVPAEAWLRFLAPEILSQDRVIYLDCDLVVLKDLAPLWETDLKGRSTGAAPDFLWDRGGANGAHLRALGHHDALPYYNSGVLLMDLAAWRARHVGERLMAFGAQKGSALRYDDQDALNILLAADDILPLATCWNLQARMYRLSRRAFPVEYDATRTARRDPAILHYTTENKPWLPRSRCPGKGHYYRHSARTDWARDRQAPSAPMARAEGLLDRTVARLGGDYMVIADLYLSLRRVLSRKFGGVASSPVRRSDR